MQVWHQHHHQSIILILSTLFVTLALFSFFSKNRYQKIVFAIFLFGLVGFLCSTLPFSYINQILRNIPIVNQIFRNSFTKLLVPTSFSLSVLIGISLSRFKKTNLILLPLIILVSLPSFLVIHQPNNEGVHTPRIL